MHVLSYLLLKHKLEVKSEKVSCFHEKKLTLYIVQGANSVEDISQWTKDQAQAYLDKYHIVYDKSANDESILDTAKRYHHAALANTNTFINNKTDMVNRMIDAAKLKLTNSYKLSTENVNALTNDLQHGLKQLELSGSLTYDKVKQTLDRLQHKAVQQKIITEAQFKELANDIQDSFTRPSWYQRLLGTVPSTSDLFPEDSYHTWLKSTITTRLEQNKELTKDQIASTVDTLKKAISTSSSSSSKLSKLGDANWWNKLSRDIEKNAKLKEGQAEELINSLRDEVTAYKIFAMDYASETTDKTQNMLWRASQYLMDTGSNVYQAVMSPLKARSASVSSAVSSAASSAADASSESDTILRSRVPQGVSDAKDSFGHYWRQKELESYQKLGYTDAHLEWIQNYISKAFNDKKDMTKDTIANSIHTIRQYLSQTKVQTAAEIDAQLKSFEELIEYWRKHGARDEL